MIKSCPICPEKIFYIYNSNGIHKNHCVFPYGHRQNDGAFFVQKEGNMKQRDIKEICCPNCGKKLGTYDGRSSINKILDCRTCRKRVVYNIDTVEIVIKEIPRRNTSSGVTFH